MWTALLYAVSWHVALGFNSDNANAVLAGHDLLHNPLLRGWVLPGDPYWSVDLPVFGAVSALVGTGPAAMHLAPVLTAVALTGVGLWAVRRDQPGAAGWLGAAAVVVVIGLPDRLLAQFLLTGPQHVGTTTPYRST